MKPQYTSCSDGLYCAKVAKLWWESQECVFVGIRIRKNRWKTLILYLGWYSPQACAQIRHKMMSTQQAQKLHFCIVCLMCVYNYLIQCWFRIENHVCRMSALLNLVASKSDILSALWRNFNFQSINRKNKFFEFAQKFTTALRLFYCGKRYKCQKFSKNWWQNLL